MAQPQKYPQLGPLRGPGTTTSDSIPAMYSKGEVVISAADVKAIGKAFGKNYLSNLVKTASKDTPPKLGAQTMVKDGKLKASGGFGLDGEDVSGGIDWNQGMPDWNEGQTKFMGGTLFAAGGFNPEDAFKEAAKQRVDAARKLSESMIGSEPKIAPNNAVTSASKIGNAVGGALKNLQGAGSIGTQVASQVLNSPLLVKQRDDAISNYKTKIGLAQNSTPFPSLADNKSQPETQASSSAAVPPNAPSNPAISQPKATAPIGSMAKPSQGQYSLSIIDQMLPDQADKVAPSSADSADAQQSKTQSGFIQTDNGIPYNVAKQADGTNTINFTNPDGTGTGTLSGLSGKQAGRFRDGKGAAYSGTGLPDVKPAQIGAQQMQQPYLGDGNIDEQPDYEGQLRDIALNGGPDRFTSLSEFSGAKRRQRAAQSLLGMLGQDNQNKRQHASENAKIAQQQNEFAQQMAQAKTQEERNAIQQRFNNMLGLSEIAYKQQRDEKGDQAASAKAEQENAIAQAKLGIDQSKLALDTKNADKTHYGVKIDENGNPISYPTDGPGAEAQINFQRNFAKRVSDPDYAVAVKKFGVEKADQLYEDHLRSQVK